MPVYAAIGNKGGIASQTSLATIEGLKVLERGGNAFDAAIATSSILTVMLPNLSGIGGDGFLLALDRNSELIAYNGSGRSPRDFSVNRYLEERPVNGPITITVPGLVDLWEWLNDNYGSIGLAELLNRAASLAKNGFFVQEPLANAVESSRSGMERYEGWNKVFGRMKTGSWASLPRLSRIYAAVAKKGSDAFYRSKLTEEIVQELNAPGEIIIAEGTIYPLLKRLSDEGHIAATWRESPRVRWS
jgi:gamma-glutamyltranspeptidase/glutathione hydrolase